MGMFINPLPSEPSNQLQSSPRPSPHPQFSLNNPFLDKKPLLDQSLLKLHTNNPSTRPAPIPKPIKLLTPSLNQLLPLDMLPMLLPQLSPPVPSLPQLLPPVPSLPQHSLMVVSWLVELMPMVLVLAVSSLVEPSLPQLLAPSLLSIKYAS